MLGYAVYIAVASRHGETLLTARAFQALSIFNLASIALNVLIQTLPEVIGMFSCFDRIGKFLQGEAHDDNRSFIDSPHASMEKIPLIDLPGLPGYVTERLECPIDWGW